MMYKIKNLKKRKEKRKGKKKRKTGRKKNNYVTTLEKSSTLVQCVLQILQLQIALFYERLIN